MLLERLLKGSVTVNLFSAAEGEIALFRQSTVLYKPSTYDTREVEQGIACQVPIALKKRLILRICGTFSPFV
jgi:hypothetical protein